MLQNKDLDKLIKQSGGIITARFVEENNIHREYLSEYVKQGKLERVAYGVYITSDVWEDKMLIHQLRKRKMIYSHETALYLHGLTDREPLVYTVTVPYGYNTSRLKKEDLIVYAVKTALFELGLCVKKSVFGNDIRTYDQERTICDLIRDRNNQDRAILTEALKKFFERSDKDIGKLIDYAGSFRIKNALRPYLEVLL